MSETKIEERVWVENHALKVYHDNPAINCLETWRVKLAEGTEAILLDLATHEERESELARLREDNRKLRCGMYDICGKHDLYSPNKRLPCPVCHSELVRLRTENERVCRWENGGVDVWLPACYSEWGGAMDDDFCPFCGGKIEVGDETI